MSLGNSDRRLCKSATKKKIDKMFAQLESDKVQSTTVKRLDEGVHSQAEKKNCKKHERKK